MIKPSKLRESLPDSKGKVKLPGITEALASEGVIGESGSLNGSDGSVYSKREAVGGLLGTHSQPLSNPVAKSRKRRSKPDANEPWGKRMPDGTIQSWASIYREALCQELSAEDEDFSGIDDYED
ncbi:unnamed protein product [marine sediment metagenome]|uniref:Uncharacterized protein n=1 Tax=marine sediment metagenome TaxID=412755 RepID=X1JS33_9ZZZZ